MIKTLYVFVDIGIDVQHFVETVRHNFAKHQKLIMMGTIQFTASLQMAKETLEDSFEITIPQAKPLSPGEVLGCTSPRMTLDADTLIYLGDGRFHLESMMIHNPHLKAYRYYPYSKAMTAEYYEHDQMHDMRKGAIESAKSATKFGLILGTLGRQGSLKVLEVHT